MKKHIQLIISIIILCTASLSYGQVPCASLLTNEYVSDGQYYAETIEAGEKKSCELTMLMGNEYRIIACLHNATKIHMQIIDLQGNTLFDNKEYNYINYWNFQVNKTITCKLFLEIVENDVQTDDVILLIGFKK